MKKALLSLALICLFKAPLFSQAVFPNSDSVINYLKGPWRWAFSWGGVAGWSITPASTGYSQAIVFSRIPGSTDSIAYKFYQNNSLQSSGNTKINSTLQSGPYVWNLAVRLYPPPVNPMTLSIFKAKTDSVWLNDNCSDCYLRTFVRDYGFNIGLDKQSIDAVKLFPNPAQGELYLTLTDNVPVTIRLFDITGKELSQPRLIGQHIDVSVLPPGLYFLQATTSSGGYSARFIKE